MALRVWNLNRKLRNLQDQLQQAERNHQERINQLQRYYEEAIADMERRKNQAIEDYFRDLREEDHRALQEEMAKIREATEARLRALEEENAAFRRECQQLNAELVRTGEELKAQIEALKKAQTATDQEHKAIAEDLIASARQVCTELDELPVTETESGEYTSYVGLLDDARRNMEHKMYEAACAAAASARAMLQGLISRVHGRITEWNTYYSKWERMCMDSKDALNSLVHDPVCTKYRPVVLTDPQWDYWSSGSYGDFRRELDEHLQQIHTIREMGVRKYLKQRNALTIMDLRDKIRLAYAYESRHRSIGYSVDNELTLCHEREMMAEAIRQTVEQNAYWPIVPGRFAPPDYVIADKPWYKAFQNEIYPDVTIEDYSNTEHFLEHYEMLFTYLGGDTLRVLIVPERVDGVAVFNRCLLAVTLNRAPDPAILRDLQLTNHNRISAAVQNFVQQMQLTTVPPVDIVARELVDRRVRESQTGTFSTTRNRNRTGGNASYDIRNTTI